MCPSVGMEILEKMVIVSHASVMVNGKVNIVTVARLNSISHIWNHICVWNAIATTQ